MKLILVAALSVLAVIAIAERGHAQQGSAIGRHEYLAYCATCHGPAGKGDGPVASSLKRTPADLTRLTEANKGVFPFARIYNVIDGRFDVMAHGPRDMPVWGEVFQFTRGTEQTGTPPFVPKELSESIVRARILALIEYISTLQGH